jgi:O-antigen/teichoic acid export membrane protein
VAGRILDAEITADGEWPAAAASALPLQGSLADLKTRTVRGGIAKSLGQIANLFLRMGSLMVLARLLEPEDFGLVGMVTAVTGVLSLFREFGLSSATVQQVEVTDQQVSSLFWINMLVGGTLTAAAIAGAPLVADFYRDPRLSTIMMALASGFLFNAAGVQHSALLQRQMRFMTLTAIDVLSLIISSVVSILIALQGFGYWALVAWSLSLPLSASALVWIYAGWTPGRPRVGADIRAMMRFGGTLTLNSLICYVAYNLDKVLLGRFWGAEAIGVYGRAYQLITLPTDNLNAAAGGIGFPVLSRLQHDPPRLRSYFLNAYRLIVGIAVPVMLMCALYADELILVMLGSKWHDAIPLFRLLAPMILIFALINPPGWFLLALGMVRRSLSVALAIAPLVVAGYLLGLPYGPRGVAIGYSVAMSLWVVPHLVWCFRGTMVSFQDVLHVVGRPLAAGAAAAIASVATLYLVGPIASPLFRLLVGGSIFGVTYLMSLLIVMGQKSLYVDVLRAARASQPVPD